MGSGSPRWPNRRLRSMATWDDVARIALALPEASERVSRDRRQWRVKDKLFVWDRPLRRADLEALGDDAPDGPILGARVEHLLAKEALLADDPGVFFTTPHFDGYPAVLVRLERIAPEDLDEVIVEAWLARAPSPGVRRRVALTRSGLAARALAISLRRSTASSRDPTRASTTPSAKAGCACTNGRSGPTAFAAG